MRTIAASALTALQGPVTPIAVLVEMDLSTPLFLNSSGMDLTLAGISYTGVNGIGKVDAVQDSPSEVRALLFSISGVPSSAVSLALSEPVRGKAVRVKFAVFDPTTYQLLDVRLRWAGVLDVMKLKDGPTTATIEVSAEHAGIDLLRSTTSLYSDLDQRRLNPGDLAFQFISAQSDMVVVWPASSWGRK